MLPCCIYFRICTFALDRVGAMNGRRGNSPFCFTLHSLNRASAYTYVRMTNRMHAFLNNLFHLFILVINQLDAQNLYYNKFISCLYMFRALLCSSLGGQNCIISLWYHHTYMWPSRARDGHL